MGSDTGRVLSETKRSNSDRVSLSHTVKDAMMSKLILLENGLGRLEKLDKLDIIKSNVKSLSAKITGFDNRLSITETMSKETTKLNFI